MEKFHRGITEWRVEIADLARDNVRLDLESALPTLVLWQLRIIKYPHALQGRYVSRLELGSMHTPARLGLFSQDAVKPEAVMSLSIAAPSEGEMVGGINLWVSKAKRRMGVGRALLEHSGDMVAMTLQGLRYAYCRDLETEKVKALRVIVTSDPDPSMEPKLDRGIWYQKIKRILEPQGFEEQRDIDTDGSQFPYLVQTFEL